MRRRSGEAFPGRLPRNAQCRADVGPAYSPLSQRIDLCLKHAARCFHGRVRRAKRIKQLFVGHRAPTGECLRGGLQDPIADAHAHIADVNLWPAIEFFYVALRLSAKRTAERAAAAL